MQRIAARNPTVSKAKRKSSERALLEEASRWVRVLPTAGIDDRERFVDWIEQSPAHLRAYLFAQDREDGASALKLWTIGAAVVLVGCAAALLAWLENRATREIYQTSIGERKEIALPDHSRVQLDSRSAIRVSFSKTKRMVDLVAGQALFTVMRDLRRPFVVTSGATQITDSGTKFNIDRNRTSTVVSVMEGSVRVSRMDPQSKHRPAAIVELTAGQQITMPAQTSAHPVPFDVTFVTQWTQGTGGLTFTSVPLSTVIDEFNRYNLRQIRMSPAVADSLISATFASTDPRGLIEFLERRPGLQVEENQQEIDIVPAKTHR